MGFWDFFHNRYKLQVHIVQIILIVIAMGLSVPRLFLKNQPRTRANTIALGMGAKSLGFIAYQLLSEHVRAFKKWKSYKAYAILNGLDIPFWGAVAFLVMQANLKRCNGISCQLGWGVVGVGIVMNQLCVYMFLVTYREFRLYKQGHAPATFEKTRSGDDSRDMQLPTYVPPTQPKPSYTQHEVSRMESGQSGYSYPPPPRR
ncbi:hypothetical protein HII31_07846 [Pseudocercospora fuligena]|uniref:Uncharacterized protein n=1 Tax=Pseudocercospora fuligena TaxID=685502 RepID=A0A8H6RHJ8_9PEZI|nr:hypothetical protein HII31_07846 [Pseudocercospora fuligena]